MDRFPDPLILAADKNAEIRALPYLTTPVIRAIRHAFSRKIKHADPEYVLDLARQLFKRYDHRWIAYEILASHHASFRCIGKDELEEFGQGINSWWTVDAFARTLSGPAWRDGQVSDELILHWVKSPDIWWRWTALVSTVTLNVRTKGDKGDVPRTLAICQLLVNDHKDIIEKALSWALRELVVHDPLAVENFLEVYKTVLGARVIREVRNKLSIGLKKTKKEKGIGVRNLPISVASRQLGLSDSRYKEMK